MTTYLTGVVNAPALKHTHRPDLGLLITPDTKAYGKYIDAFGTWAADNGCFSQTKVFDPQRWITWLDGSPREGCLWATAPDVVGDHNATVARSAEWLPIIRKMGFQAAFVLQNHATVANVPWCSFDTVFVGGVPECIPCGYERPAAEFRMKRCPLCNARLTEWKTSAAVLPLIAEAQRRDMQVHIGRVNTWERLSWSASVGADSADGTYFMFGPPEQQVGDMIRWLDRLANKQPALPFAA